MTRDQRAVVWAVVTMNIVVWSAIGAAAATGRTQYPWWILPVVIGAAALAGLLVGRRVE